MDIVRRRLLTTTAGLLATAAASRMPVAATEARPDAAGARWIAPGGTGEGLTPETAAPPAALDDLIGALSGTGGVVHVRADLGPYEGAFADRPVTAAPEREVTVRGSDGAGRPMPAVIDGARPMWTQRDDAHRPKAKAGPQWGSRIFLLRGARRLRFSHFAFQNVGNGAFCVEAPSSDVTIEDCTGTNLYRFIEAANVPAVPLDVALVTGLTVRRCRAEVYERSFARFRHASHTVLIEDCEGDSGRLDGDRFAAGIAIEDGCHDMVFRRCAMRNHHDDNGKGYWNADGFFANDETYNILFEDCEATGNTDSGWDVKGRNPRWIRCRASGNKRNFRYWGLDGVAEDLSLGPCTWYGRGIENGGPAHVHVLHDGATKQGATITFRNLTIDASDGVGQPFYFASEFPGATVVVEGHRITKPASVRMDSREADTRPYTLRLVPPRT